MSLRGFKNFILTPIDGEHFEGLGFKKKRDGLEYEYYPSIHVNEVKGANVYLLLTPKNFFMEVYQITLPVYTPEVVSLRLKERIDNQGFLTGPYKIFWHELEKRENFFKFFVLALPISEIDIYKELLKKVGEAKVRAIVFFPILLVLSLPEGHESTLVLHKEKGLIWLVVVSKGIPYYAEMIPIDEMIGVDYENLKRRINFYKSLYRSEAGEDIAKTLTTSAEVAENLKNLGEEVEVFLESKEKIYEKVLRLPEKYNLLEEEEKVVHKVMAFNTKLSLVLFFLAVLVYSGSGAIWLWNKKLESNIINKERILEENLNNILNHYPPDKVAAFRKFMKKKNELESFPSPINIFTHFCNLEGGYKVEDLQIRREQNHYRLKLNLQKNLEGGAIAEEYQSLFFKLNRFLEITNSTSSYDMKNKIFTVQVEGYLKNEFIPN